MGIRDCKETGEGVAGEVIAPVFIERVLEVGQALLEVEQGYLCLFAHLAQHLSPTQSLPVPAT